MITETDTFRSKRITCAGCGQELTAYEINACRLISLEKPVCMGCAVKVIKFLREHLMPMLDEVLKILTAERS